ncbi:Angiopoietin-2 [Liparis tanakae]|uniref:Angiopoietin-2 n=1 Tax=Liparis tanakae TaxID=230148 RepID=A0A4Z2GRQ3_9TELE|nr:Angiopoietin-2 [Liparis tanakae]
MNVSLVQVIHHSTRLERKLLENSLSTNKLEKQLIIQTNDIRKLNDKNSFLEKKVDEMEEQRQVALKMLRDEKEQLQALVLRQTAIIGELELQLLKVSSNNSGLQRQQQELLDTVNALIHSISVSSAREIKAVMMQDTPTTFMDCAAVFKSGNTQSGVYTLTLPNTTIEVKVE